MMEDELMIEKIAKIFSESLDYMKMGELKSNPSQNYVGLTYHFARKILTLIRKREILARLDEIEVIMWMKEHSDAWEIAVQNRAETMEQQLKEME